MDLLKDMHCKLEGHFSRILHLLYIKNKNQLCMMVGLILMISRHTQKALEKQYKKKVPDEIQNLSIVTGAQVDKESILKSGEVVGYNLLGLIGFGLGQLG
ncbi:hypothetical protein DFH28DRAFT_895998 [Melampsora americana]|nr:hypothetical protein DFH28DRAFT_895998 [Melampsora americana]